MQIKQLLSKRVIPTTTVGISAHSGFPPFAVRLIRLTGEAEDRAAKYATQATAAEGCPMESHTLSINPRYNYHLQWARLHEALRDEAMPAPGRFLAFAENVDELKSALSWELCCALHRLYEDWIAELDGRQCQIADERLAEVHRLARLGAESLELISPSECRAALAQLIRRIEGGLADGR